MRTARILVLRGGALGDFLVTLPALAALRHRWPDAHIEVIGYPHIARLALSGGLANRIRSLNDAGLARYFVPDALIRDEDQRYFSSFDFILQYLHDPEDCLYGNLRRCGVTVILKTSPIVEDQHATSHFLKPLESLAIYDADPVPRLCLTDIPVPEQPFVALHPGSGGRAKNWPIDRYVKLAHHIKTLGLRPVFFTGDAEVEYIPGIDQALAGFARHHNLALDDLARHLAAARFYVGNDSGISHLAAATGCPGIVLFGPSRDDLWRPNSPTIQIIKANGGDLQLLDVSRVATAVTSHLAALIE